MLNNVPKELDARIGLPAFKAIVSRICRSASNSRVQMLTSTNPLDSCSRNSRADAKDLSKDTMQLACVIDGWDERRNDQEQPEARTDAMDSSPTSAQFTEARRSLYDEQTQKNKTHRNVPSKFISYETRVHATSQYMYRL